MAQRLIVFDVDSLVRLLTHYSEGDVPLDARVKEVGFNPLLPRYIGIEVESRQWRSEETQPFHFRYAGQKVLRWGDRREGRPSWGEAPHKS